MIGAGASLGAITGGVLARFLVGPVGGTVNMLLVLAVLILFGRVDRVDRERRASAARWSRVRGGPAASRSPMRCARSRASPYLRLMAALVFLVAIATQWTAFQLSLVADLRFARRRRRA